LNPCTSRLAPADRPPRRPPWRSSVRADRSYGGLTGSVYLASCSPGQGRVIDSGCDEPGVGRVGPEIRGQVGQVGQVGLEPTTDGL
jgi:hypothetical protein